MILWRSLAAIAAVVAVVQFAAPRPALAHDNEYLATITGAHGGMVRMSGPYHFELVIREGEVRVWVTDHADNPQSTAGAHGQLVVMQGGDRAVIELAPDGGNLLRGVSSNVSAGADLRAVLRLRLLGQAALQARFATVAGGDDHDEPQGHEHAHAEH